MAGFKQPDFIERQEAAAKARKVALEKFRAWQKEHSELDSPLPLRQGRPLTDREVLGFLDRALSDIQRTSARTLATVSESYDLIRFTDGLSGPLYRSVDDK